VHSSRWLRAKGSLEQAAAFAADELVSVWGA
jgi:hypothetical protein